LNVFNWSDYVAPETVPGFEKEFGVRVRYSIYESNEEMLARVFSGNSGWDVVFPTHYIVPPMREQGLLTPLDHAKLPNLKNLDPAFARPSLTSHAVPYMWNATGILFHKKMQPPPASWADLWDPRVAGKITMLDDPAEVLAAALRKLGFSLNSGDPDQLRAAQQEAMRQKPLLRAYLNSEVRDQVVAEVQENVVQRYDRVAAHVRVLVVQVLDDRGRPAVGAGAATHAEGAGQSGVLAAVHEHQRDEQDAENHVYDDEDRDHGAAQ
jgi:spermidine/putrescine transport system substrate-binding protein